MGEKIPTESIDAFVVLGKLLEVFGFTGNRQQTTDILTDVHVGSPLKSRYTQHPSQLDPIPINESHIATNEPLAHES